MDDLRLISFLPAATEMVFALGLGDRLLGVSHECDYPAAARTKPVVVKRTLPVESMSLAEIDAAVAAHLGEGASLYEVDERLLERIAPTHILTQALCQVCAPSGNEITRALAALPAKPEVVWFTPSCLEDIFANIRELGAVTGTTAKAARLIADCKGRLARVAERTRGVVRRPRVSFLEWIDPYFCAGHWVPEMIEIAGGEDALGRKGQDSVRITIEEIVRWSPEILIVSPCGFGVEAAAEQAAQLLRQPGIADLPAARDDRIFAVNADAYYARPGPRVVDGTELLAHLFHPDRVEWRAGADAFRQVRQTAHH